MKTNQIKYATTSPLLSKIKIAEKSEGRNDHRVLARPYPHRIPEGEYLAFCIRTFLDKKSRGYGERIYIYFKIVDGEHAGKELRMFCRPSLFPTSKFYRAWVIANNGLPRSRRPILDHRVFRGKLFRVVVTTVKPRHRLACPDGKMRQGQFLPEFMFYSKVDYLLSLEVTNAPIDGSPFLTNHAPSSSALLLQKSFPAKEMSEGTVGSGELGVGNLVYR